ncbi:fumarylacetoacetase [Sulfitobacter sp. M57]|uniref:fumarylacetoacetase n=1 Tax=unclassified Sulfitobacter TaxID=196795 RepID=UPI0023E28758|nr:MULTISPECIES: fumarylacetoacetase [unclassified Sulfitobacter]MDF3416251.1 fumarylacetoacetase [Sulfitobacter sp. KE5]MDF3423730.1 fumarylacetoacetase [Sulfitobacter sp. KE43]MDF3434797.1 fumarylacetoacetase [Sulfitobacter sp. KE42]MDF3460436.1 fumarylacetoacetase [Sulfitobacter sp. S74]MDF3464334.1 fumarylacetoacetase [Sulfitobacter sp. Ks18]
MTRLTSWVESANSADTDFPLNNLPYGVFSTNRLEARCGVAIGDMVLDMAALEEAGIVTIGDDPVFDVPYWNDVMEMGSDTWASLRARLIELLITDAPEQAKVAPHLVPLSEAELHLPIAVSEYTDFYAGMQHAKNMGAILRGSPDLPANWLHIPVGYNGRASSVVVSGTEINRPNGQRKAPDAEMPSFGPSTRLDIELEMGAIVGTGTPMGHPITVDEADALIFGYVLLNDWSARDIQGWEYQPLGPFQGKAFGTTISPWIVTAAALDPFRTPTPPREKQLLPYLDSTVDGLYDIELTVSMQPEGAVAATTITKTNYNRMYYSAAEQLCHHAVGGCGMNPGDLLGSGTISGPVAGEYGSLMEISWAGRDPFTLTTGETRTFIEDGDTLTLSGHAQGDGFRIGFGDCAGKIVPAVEFP